MKKIIVYLMLCLCMLSLTLGAAFASDMTGISYGNVVDDANLLSDSEEEALKQKITSLRDKYAFDIVIVTKNSLGSATPKEFADSYFDGYGYGCGDNKDGILFLLGMETRDWYISTNGFLKQSIPDSQIASFGQRIVPYLSDSEYFDAFNTFLSETESEVVEYNSMPKNTFSDDGPVKYSGNISDYSGEILKIALIAIGSGLCVAFIVILILKGQLKSVKKQYGAGSYIKKDSFVLTQSNDMFLYSTFTKTRRPETDSSSGSSGGSSSSSHGGGGGKF